MFSCTRQHGSTDALGLARWDFSSNANACGPCPQVAKAVQQADARHYPDPAYTQLRQLLGRLHDVEPQRILLGSSASEWIQRFTGWSAVRGRRLAWWPNHAYGDLAHAAAAWGLQRAQQPAQAALVWFCEPSSPLGHNEDVAQVAECLRNKDTVAVLDCAYQPLRLDGQTSLLSGLQAQCWQLWSPNKALGMTGVRAAYAVAPEGAQPLAQELEAIAASWPIGSHGVALLAQWSQPQVQNWVRACLPTLQMWKTALVRDLSVRGWLCQPSHTPYFCAMPMRPISASALRAQGVKLRDATSFGLPGWWRFNAQPDAARQALMRALDAPFFQESDP